MKKYEVAISYITVKTSVIEAKNEDEAKIFAIDLVKEGNEDDSWESAESFEVVEIK